MQKIKSLLDQQKKRLEQGSSNSPTAAGQIEPAAPEASANKPTDADGRHLDRTDAISKIFMQFQFAYHNQYLKAFPNEQDLIIAKKFWSQSLSAYPAEVILHAGTTLVRSQPYLPSIAAMIAACDRGSELFGLPDVRKAYVEACIAPSPKSAHPWQHPAVYFAGKATGWYLLANESERTTFPLFEHHYIRICRRVMQGEELDIEAPAPLPEKIQNRLSRKELRARLGKLRKQFAS